MKKAEFLNHWKGIESNQRILIDSIPYKRGGSTYDCDGIRLTGSRVFIDSVLSNLKELLENENHATRLQLNYQESKDRETQQPLGSYNCYIQVHDRGHEAIAVNRMFA